MEYSGTTTGFIEVGMELYVSGQSWKIKLRYFMRNLLILFLLTSLLLLTNCSTENTPVYTLSTNVNPTEAGSVNPVSGEYDKGTTIEILASPNEHWVFNGWQGDHSGNQNPASIAMDSDKSITAQFIKREYPLTINIEGDGSVQEQVVQQKSTDYPHGTIVQLTANPEEGWEFYQWERDLQGDENPVQITINQSKEVTAVFKQVFETDSRVGYLSPNNFTNNQLTISLPRSNTGKSYIVAVPNLSSVDYYNRNTYIHEQLITFDLSVESSIESPTKLRSLPSINKPTLNEWEQPEGGELTELASEKTFNVWSQIDQTYVTTEGRLAYEGNKYVFYEDVTNDENFSIDDYSEMDNILNEHYTRLTQLMGEPTDLDGNSRIIVFISRTLINIRNFGEAYVDGCHLRVDPGSCQERGEFIYFMSLDNFSNSSSNREYYAKNYYPRNILHETTHLLQQGHWYRKNMPNETFSIPAFYSEGQAELMSYKTGLRTNEMWNILLNNRFSADNQEKMNPWFYPYDMGALFYWYMHQTFGDGISQSLIDAAYDSDKRNVSLTELTVEIHEALVLAMMYGSLLMDGTEIGSEYGLEFVQDDIQSRLAGTNLPITEVSINESVQEQRTYTGSVIFQINHDEPVNIKLSVDPELAYVLVIQP